MDRGAKEEGVYLYCIVEHGSKESFGEIGLENSLV